MPTYKVTVYAYPEGDEATEADRIKLGTVKVSAQEKDDAWYMAKDLFGSVA